MNVKLRVDGTPLPLADRDGNIELLLTLIKEDLKAHKLSHGLKELGCAESPYMADLTDVVLNVAGFNPNNRPNELYEAYFAMMGKHIANLNATADGLVKMVAAVYVDLVALATKEKGPH